MKYHDRLRIEARGTFAAVPTNFWGQLVKSTAKIEEDAVQTILR